jgi:hypothetical protein
MEEDERLSRQRRGTGFYATEDERRAAGAGLDGCSDWSLSPVARYPFAALLLSVRVCDTEGRERKVRSGEQQCPN